MEIHHYWTIPRQAQRMTTHPSQRSGGCSTITEEREVSWCRQLNNNRSGSSKWRGCIYRPHNNLQQDLADRRMASPVDPVLSNHTFQERQPAAVPELPNDQPHQPPSKVMLKIKLKRLKPQVEKIIAEEQAAFRAGRSTTELIQPTHSL